MLERYLLSINSKAKEVTRALPQRRTSIPTINTGR